MEILKVDDIIDDIFPALYSFDNDMFQWIKILYGNNKSTCDIHYKIHSGSKWLSYGISRLYSDQKSNIVTSYIANMFGRKWSKYWDVLIEDYIPNENHRMETQDDSYEINTEFIKSIKNNVDEYKNDKNVFHNEGSKENRVKNSDSRNEENNNSLSYEKEENSSSSADQIYAFNSINGSDSDRTDNISNNRNNSSNTENNTSETYSSNREDSDYNREINRSENETNTVSKNENESKDSKEDNSKKNTTNKRGLYNISNQELLEQELEFRKTLFLDIVFNDMDSFITIPCY